MSYINLTSIVRRRYRKYDDSSQETNFCDLQRSEKEISKFLKKKTFRDSFGISKKKNENLLMLLKKEDGVFKDYRIHNPASCRYKYTLEDERLRKNHVLTSLSREKSPYPSHKSSKEYLNSDMNSHRIIYHSRKNIRIYL